MPYVETYSLSLRLRLMQVDIITRASLPATLRLFGGGGS